MTHDKPVLGILLMLGFCILAPMADAIAKLLSNRVPIAEVVFIRFALQVLILAPLVWSTGRIWLTPARVRRVLLLRTVVHIAAIWTMLTALTYLELADAVAIVFVMPFFLLLLGRTFLNEQVGLKRLSACIVGFLGALLVIQPSFITVGWPALLPVLVALLFAFYMLLTRHIAKASDPIAQQAISGMMAMLILAPLLVIGTWVDAPLVSSIWPTQNEWALLIALGIIGTLAHLMMTWSLRYAPSTTLAPMQYLEIPVATLLGLVIFQDLPDALASLGIMLIISAGLYILMREQAISRRPAQAIAPQYAPDSDAAR
ncbi:MAG: DMT family transporter [Pseudomonadota bacterium]